MKKLLIAVALLLSVQAVAQNISPEKAKAMIDKAKVATEDPKKASKAKTWISLAETYIKVDAAPTKNISVGMTQADLKAVIGSQQVLSTENVTVSGAPALKEVYADKDVYYDENGTVIAIVVTKPRYEGNLLEMAAEALVKATEFTEPTSGDGQKIMNNMEVIKTKFYNDAISYYTVAKYESARDGFSNAAALAAFTGQVDTTAIFNTGLTAMLAKDNENAIKNFEACIALGYDQNGDLYSYLADVYKTEGQYDKMKEVLGKGFTKYPNSQAILVSLINAYLDTNDDPKKVLEYIKIAQNNEPGNPTLYYAEGNVWRGLNDYDKAIESYRKSLEIDPNFVYGYFSIGDLLYTKALEIQDKASQEFDDAKYEALMVEFDKTLKSAIEPFEKAFSVTEDKEIKVVVAEFLKNIYFRFRDAGDEYKAAHDKYKAIVDNGL